LSFRHILAACLGYSAAITIAHAQPVNFICPVPGLVEQQEVATLKYNGASTGDPYVCIRVDAWGKPQQRLFNFYPLSNSNNTPAANVAARSSLIELLSGQKTSVSFPYTGSDGYILQEVWTFLRREPYNLDGKRYDTIVLSHEETADPRGRSNFHGRYVRWLDLKSGLWLKAELTVIGGEANKFPKAYQDQSITLP
jgi:hypothetical protein